MHQRMVPMVPSTFAAGGMEIWACIFVVASW